MTQQCLKCHRGISHGTHRRQGSTNPLCLECTASIDPIDLIIPDFLDVKNPINQELRK